MSGLTVLERDRITLSDALDVMAHGRPSYERTRAVRTYRTNAVFFNLDAREVYSYGRHFPLFRLVRRGRRRPLVILNGDAWRGSRSRTSDHQRICRDLAAELGAETCVIPFSALSGAGIELDSIRPIHVRPDANWTEDRSARELAEIPRFRRERWDRDSETMVSIDRGPDGLYHWTEHVHRLGDCLFTAERNGRRRALFLSSFDYQEHAPLYFLAQLPRGTGAVTVDMALDALAPRAVHAARARGREVKRQGDIFFIRTDLGAAELEARGIVSRARLTQFTRGARARKGETGYVAPLDANGRRRMAQFRRAEYRRIVDDARAKVTAAFPKSEKGARRAAAKRRAELERKIANVRAELRTRAIGRKSSGRAYARYRESQIHAERRALAERATRARERLNELEAQLLAERLCGRRATRDAYRAPFSAGPISKLAWSMSGAAARARFIPSEWHGPTIEARRENVRRALAIYGTAHSAREVIRTRVGSVYVAGTVRHVPELERGRTGRPDHRPIELGAGYWLAVRNTVPRQDSRRRA